MPTIVHKECVAITPETMCEGETVRCIYCHRELRLTRNKYAIPYIYDMLAVSIATILFYLLLLHIIDRFVK